MPNYQQHIVYLSEAQLAELFANGTITVDGVTVTYSDNDLYVTPMAIPVLDIQIDGSSIKQNSIANIPKASGNALGVVLVDTSHGLHIGNDGTLGVLSAGVSHIKAGSNNVRPLTAYTLRESIYYGLPKLAGADMASASGETVGVYPDAQKQAIQKMLGLDGLFGDYQTGNTASRAYAAGETFVMDGKRYKVTAAISDGGLITVGTNCELDPVDGRYVKNIDYATSSKAGVAKIGAGLYMYNGELRINKADASSMKAGTDGNSPVVPKYQHTLVYYALAKLAGADMASLSGETVGIYPEAQKQAIQSMLGVSTGAILIENVSGGTPTLTCLPNVRYKCGEVSTLSITPPASGSCEVIFESGSTATLLTVPNTVKFPPWFDATALETGMIYDIIITDGVYGAVMSWAS